MLNLRVSALGFGSCGGHCVNLANQLGGIPAIAANTSEGDLNALSFVQTILINQEGRGSGRRREVTKAIMDKYIAKLLKDDRITSMVESSDIICIVSSADGGTGSVCAPIMYDLLTELYEDKVFILQYVLPPLNESLVGHEHTIEFLKDLDDMKGKLTYMCYDSNKYTHLPMNEAFRLVDVNVARDIIALQGDGVFSTNLKNLDQNDFLGLIRTPGRLAMYHFDDVKEKDIEEGLIGLVKTQSKSNAHAPLQHDMKVVLTSIICNMDIKMNKYISDLQKNLPEVYGEPILDAADNIAYYEGEGVNTFSVILSGLSHPNSRFQMISDRLNEIEKKIGNMENTLDVAKTDTSKAHSIRDSFTRSKNVSNNNKSKLNDVLNKVKAVEKEEPVDNKTKKVATK